MLAAAEGARAQPLSSLYHVNPNVNAANVNAERAEAFSTGWPMLIRRTGRAAICSTPNHQLKFNQRSDEEPKPGPVTCKIQSRY